jgi:hypothetical protein
MLYATELNYNEYYLGLQKGNDRRYAIISLFGHPEDHARLFPHFCGKVCYPAEFHARGHAMLDASRFEAFPRQMRAKNADLGWKWEIGKIRPAVGKLLFDLKYLDAADAGFMGIFLSARQLATVATRAIFVVD